MHPRPPRNVTFIVHYIALHILQSSHISHPIIQWSRTSHCLASPMAPSPPASPSPYPLSSSFAGADPLEMLMMAPMTIMKNLIFACWATPQVRSSSESGSLHCVAVSTPPSVSVFRPRKCTFFRRCRASSLCPLRLAGLMRVGWDFGGWETYLGVWSRRCIGMTWTLHCPSRSLLESSAGCLCSTCQTSARRWGSCKGSRSSSGIGSARRRWDVWRSLVFGMMSCVNFIWPYTWFKDGWNLYYGISGISETWITKKLMRMC